MMGTQERDSSMPGALAECDEDMEMQQVNITPQAQPLKASWRHLFLFTRKTHIGPVSSALLAACLTGGFKTVLSIILGKIFDIIADFSNGKIDGNTAVSSISRWCLILLGLGIGNWISSTAFLALWIGFGELQANGVREEVYASLMAKEMTWYDSQTEGISSLLVRIQTQTRELQLATSQVFGLLVSDIISSLASVGIALSYSWKLTLVLLATLPVSAIILSLATRRLEPAIQQQKHHLATASKHATASITAIDLVKVFNGYDYEIKQYLNAVRLAARHYMIQAQCNAIQTSYVSFWTIFMFVVGFWYGVALVNNGLKPGAVLTTFYSTLAAFQGIEALIPHWLILAKGMSAGAFLSSITKGTSRKQRIQAMVGSLKPPSCAGDVELTNVTFAYPSNPKVKVLSSSSFFFPAGEVTFIVGRSGSGKSTLGNLIVGFYEPTTGVVEIDGHPTQTLDRDWVRENITLIQQSSVLFNDTFFHNVVFGHRDPDNATKEDVNNACEAALLQSTLSTLPHGLETVIGSGGYNLSGGQKQRLALARARLRDPPVLILDEITSGLDPVSRSLVMEAVRQWRKGKTTIIITHDVSQIGEKDFVYVMDNAHVVQEGLGRDLIRDLTGHFASLAAAPAIEEDPETPIEINIISPVSPGSDFPELAVLENRASRVSQFLLGELEDNAMRSGALGLPRPTSLGAGTDLAFRLKAEQAWQSEVYPHYLKLSTNPSDDKGTFFSRRLSSTTQAEDTVRSSKQVSLGSLNISGDIGGSEHVGQDPTYVFGESQRRDNIQSLRVARTVPQAQPIQQATEEKMLTNTQPPMALMAIIKTVWPAIGSRDKLALILGMLACLLSGAASPAFSYCFAMLLGAMWSPGNKLAEGMKWALYLIAIAVSDGICAGVNRYLMEYAGQAWVNAIRVQALKRILQQPKTWFERSAHSAGRINECLDRNAEEMRNIVGRFIPIVVHVTVTILVAITWAIAISWKLSLVSMAPLPIVMGAVKSYSMVSGKWEARCNKGAEDTSATLTEILLNIRVVKALTLEGYFGRRYLNSASDTLSLGYKRAVYTSGLFGLYQSLNYPMTALVFYYGTVLLARKREISATAVLQVVNLLLFSMGSSTGVLSAIPQITMAQATATLMLGYANMPMHPSSEKEGLKKPKSPLPVRFNELAFSYRPSSERQVLRRVSFEVNAGECLAIVGPSGCGKSTVVSLLLGLYMPSTASSPVHASPLTFSGMPSSEIDVQHIQSTMAYVSQAPFLFPGTIAENIAYGLPESSSLRRNNNLIAAAQAAGIHSFIISLPESYNTIVGDGGQALSGGQSQRLSIARALFRKPKLLILDEPTSALDAESCDMIRHTIQDLVQESRTKADEMAIVIVTHSREMMRIADRIAVLEDGIKVEEGTYDGLLQLKSHFAQLVSSGEWVKESETFERRD